MTHVEGEAVAARLARSHDDLLLLVALQHRLWVVAVLAQDEFLDEAVQHVLEFGGLVGAVDDVAFVLKVKLGLGPELATKVLSCI